MTHVREAIRTDQRLAIDLILPGPPDMTITDVIGELYIADDMVGWVSTAVVGPMYSGNPLHVRHGEFVDIDDGPPWRFVVEEETGKRIATIYPVERNSELAYPANEWAEWRSKSDKTRHEMREFYVRMLNDAFNVTLSTAI